MEMARPMAMDMAMMDAPAMAMAGGAVAKNAMEK